MTYLLNHVYNIFIYHLQIWLEKLYSNIWIKTSYSGSTSFYSV